ncbi:hypothetical protein DOTSEDRAFT_51183 [Dothistroma septosporum NZE10]|uniref:F-box domain-containing protein n=1 Tax=Dothistroma septosporum (strain NZE10 / CBS 128990) TaxID=675120 RepID=N1PWI3_DOTSN|nr:hypothetical protein DOTSEDRAFT_51183 [Dothistroma septosporum NZE10]
MATTSSKADDVFRTPELLERILLSLPFDRHYEEMSSMRTIILSRTTTRTWHDLIEQSSPIRQRLYLTTPLSASESKDWQEQHACPPARPNPWIPDLILKQRSWGTAYPFDITSQQLRLKPSSAKHWTFSFEISRMQFFRFPVPGPWREMIVASPPFVDFWYTRCFYELGSGRAPFVTHMDYDPKLPKSKQKYRVHCSEGATLGNMVDAASELMEKHSEAKFVMIESVRTAGELELSEARPTTEDYVPGICAEKAFGWQRGV